METDESIKILQIVGYGLVALAIIIGIWFVINYPIPEAYGLWEKEQAIRNMEPLMDLIEQFYAYGQSNTTVPKAVTSPPNPTPTTPNPNFQYLPQKAFVLPFAPENGVPNTPSLATPLSPVPTIANPVPPVQQAVPVQNSTNIIDSLGGYTGIMAMLGAAGVYLKTRVLDKKTDKIDDTTKQQSAQIVKGAIVDQKIADQVYQNMGEEANKINDKPEIKLENLKHNIDEATETATKA